MAYFAGPRFLEHQREEQRQQGVKPLACPSSSAPCHGSGGATTLKVYAAWVARADQQASELLAARLPAPRPRS